MEKTFIPAHLLAIQLLLVILFYSLHGITGVVLVIAMYFACCFGAMIHK